MPFGIRFERAFAANASFDLNRRHGVLLFDRVAQDCEIAPVEEVQDAIVHASPTNSELVDAISEQIRQWSPQFVAESGKALDRGHTGYIRLLICLAELSEPVEDGTSPRCSQ